MLSVFFRESECLKKRPINIVNFVRKVVVICVYVCLSLCAIEC